MAIFLLQRALSKVKTVSAMTPSSHRGHKRWKDISPFSWRQSLSCQHFSKEISTRCYRKPNLTLLQPCKAWNLTNKIVTLIDVFVCIGMNSPGKTMEEEESPIFTSVNSTGLEECVVAYMDDCTSLGKCENTCRSMGAARQRWFHNGCCECVGSSCLSYGKNEPQCKECPIEDYWVTMSDGLIEYLLKGAAVRHSAVFEFS